MSTSIDDRSLRKQTGAIHWLDAARARELVALFFLGRWSPRPTMGSPPLEAIP